MSNALSSSKSYLVVRSPVTPKKQYGEHIQELRVDFWFTCAYCTISEIEASGLGFQIDHYEPRTSRPDLALEYSNLMYSCQHCNSRKREYCPPPAARLDGKRFFKADLDDARNHFSLVANDTIDGTTPVGAFTITMLDLNRPKLLQLRAARRRIADGLDEVAFGLRALKTLPFDKMSNAQRLRIGFAAHEMETDSAKIERALTKLVRSEMLDDDPEKEVRSKQRRAHLAEWQVQYPDPWRGSLRK